MVYIRAGFVVILFSAIIAAIADELLAITSPPLFWLFGALTGMVAAALFAVGVERER